MKINRQQKAAIKALIISRVGQSVADKAGKSKSFELESYYQFAEKDWDGTMEYTITVSDIVNNVSNRLKENTVFEELVIDIEKYHFDYGQREHEDKIDQIGITYEDILEVI